MTHPIKDLREGQGSKRFTLRCSIADNQIKETKANKPYTQLVITDREFREPLKIWDNFSCAAKAKELVTGQIVDLTGTFSYSSYGFQCEADLDIYLPTESESQEWLEENLKNPKAESQLETARLLIELTADPILKEVGRIVLERYRKELLLSGGARFYHHARRGGLVEHLVKMMESASILAPLYGLNKDLTVIGAWVHDLGKIKENQYEEMTLNMPFNPEGEMLSHIPVGMMLVDDCLKEARTRLGDSITEERFKATRIHLLHLVGSHHGTNDWGSPVTPKTKEALLLHTIDNLDAKIEFYEDAYEQGKIVAESDGVILHEKKFPFPGCISQSLPLWSK